MEKEGKLSNSLHMYLLSTNNVVGSKAPRSNFKLVVILTMPLCPEYFSQ